MPSLRFPISGCNKQQGGALLVMLVILVMGITTVFFTALSGTALKNHRDQISATSLAQAKEALIGYAATYGDTNTAKPHGFLPCPDTNGSAGANPEGSSEACGTTNVDVLGRLPWRTLDLPPLFDGAGECLWYAVSGNYKSTQTSPPPMNWDTPGQLHVYDRNGNEITPGEIVAVVIAPGTPLNSNTDRAGGSAPTCGGNYSASAYLDNDSVHAINNANISQGKFILPHEDSSTVSTNDQIVFITRQDIWNIIQKRIARQAKNCLDDYAADAANIDHKYPWAAQVNDTTTSPGRSGAQGVLFGRFPDIPNISIPGGGSMSGFTPSQISTLNNYIQQVQNALNDYLAGTGTLSTLRNKGDNLKDVAGNYPYNLPYSNPIRAAGSYADNCSGMSCTTTLQSMLDSAMNELTGSGSDGSMPSTWSSIASCQQLITSASWPEWRDWTFYQVADGFQPGAGGACVSCLSISGSGNTNGGSGNYRAAIAMASRMTSGQTSRTATSIADYLEGTNQSGTNFLTYRPSDPNYSTVNDLVVCVDGKNNCK